MEIKDQVAVITGGGSGMGAETARFLRHRGAKVVLLDKEIDKARDIAKELDGLAVECDVSDAKSSEAAVKTVVKKFQFITININCAGIAPASRIVKRDGAMPLADFQKVIDVNLIGTFNLLRLCAEQMVKQGSINDDGERGVIINTASIAAYEGQIGQAAYSASKGGIAALTLPAARELSKFGIRVMTIAPGVIATPMMANMPDEVKQSLAGAVPFPSRLGQPREYARLVGEIIENPYLNGSVIRLDGALRMAGR
ncbi:SDR family NAD(P)-dependent oxidoreductase [Coxiella burnetii]|uniref:3-hydroxyacyl CoA dehydrogenase n=1 Tax=Coxiella burnetii (strain RSA 493 / Nine Mile phase I) TaxID=227377 RepID=Q820W4_COXBU|nr:SDR family NAD(P)-dependent oxidoreductase [Coxiella burnetii]NP_819867.1 3-hydroxyacyl CoA dehydrogenase [Coxiella burnetii RSA 493]AAO90381.1 3-hydroxyacyl CoA dehydrogenase [Coxiella burnetii RSA 493]ABX77298.1 oxidoreductase, short chain dehydrogenase/reductase family [Coxiella burnetii RSA 331]AML49151.1 3-hydroxy-2-methylbutyryl-CoA dehydrogenase [Coxiella burnetii]AML55086.1 3-hydroxy-2-methylbutyryl-CoA dehydrogenase [Coxiella burnetii]ARI65680.1 3-hydroxyacyl-CoA dehydrogenase [Co